MIVIKAIKSSRPFDSKVFRQEIVIEAKELGAFVKKDFEKTTRTWTHQPEFTVDVQTASGTGVLLQVMTEDKVYEYLDQGTRVRYATMTNPFIAKTRPRQIKSWKGKGGLLFVNKKRPRPGIEAREFTKTLTQRWKPGFQRGIQNALDRAALRSGHAI